MIDILEKIIDILERKFSSEDISRFTEGQHDPFPEFYYSNVMEECNIIAMVQVSFVRHTWTTKHTSGTLQIFFFHSIIGSKTSLHCLSDGSQFRRIRGSIISIYMFLRCLTHQQFGTLGIYCQRTWWITFLCFVKVPLQRLSAILGKFTTLITCRKIRYYIQHRATLSPVYNLQGFCYLHFQYIP